MRKFMKRTSNGHYRYDFKDGSYVELIEGWIKREYDLEVSPYVAEFGIREATETKPPYLASWMGECAYQYPGIVDEAYDWGDCTELIRDTIEYKYDEVFNSVLADYYRDGQDFLDWDAVRYDDIGPTIASVSIGATRRMRFRHKDGKTKFNLNVTNGSVLIMHDMQKDWEYCTPKTPKEVDPRINLTFLNLTSLE